MVFGAEYTIQCKWTQMKKQLHKPRLTTRERTRSTSILPRRTGRKVRIPTAIIQHYNPGEHVDQSHIQPASQPPAPSLFQIQSVMRCIMPTSPPVEDVNNKVRA